MRTSLAVELLRFLAHGIVWANHHYLLEFAGRSFGTGMPTWRAFTRGAVTPRAMLHCAMEASKMACRVQTNALSKTKSFIFLMRCTVLVLETWTRPLRLHTKTVKRGAASSLTIVASRQVAFNLRSNIRAFRKPHGVIQYICMMHDPHGLAVTIARHKHVPGLPFASRRLSHRSCRS